MKQLAGFEVGYLVKELQVLIGGKVDKIFNPDKKSILIQFYTRQAGKQILHILAPNMLFLSPSKEESGEPTGLAMQLRKLLTNSRVKFVSQIRFERVVEIIFEVLEDDNSRQDYVLFIELFGSGNTILTKAGKIIAATEYRVYSTRSLKPGDKYVCPARDINFLELTKEQLSGIFSKSTKESVIKTLAIDLGLGGVYAEELCLIAHIDKKFKLIGADDISKVYNAISELKACKPMGSLIKDADKLVDVVPIPLNFYSKYELEEFSSYNEALSKAVGMELASKPKESPFEPKIKKVLQIIDEQKKTIDAYENKAKEEQEKAELIYANYALVEKLLADITTAKKKHSWEELKSLLKNHKIIKEINDKEGKIILEL